MCYLGAGVQTFALPILSRCRPTRSRREARYSLSGRRAAPVVLVRLLLHVARTQRKVDLFLDPRAGVVLEIDAASQAAELVVEGLRLFLEPDVVVDHPQLLVDGLQVGAQAGAVLAGGRMRPPGLLQRRQLVVAVGQIGLVGHALGLDL